MNWRRHGHVERNLRLFSHWNDPLVPQSSRKQKIVKQYQSKWTLLHSLTKIQLDWCPSLGLHFLQDLHGFRLESFGRDLIADLDQNLFRSVQQNSIKGLSICNKESNNSHRVNTHTLPQPLSFKPPRMALRGKCRNNQGVRLTTLSNIS